jgi:outer membrane protein TolC
MATPFRYTAEELQALVQEQNPAVHMDANAVEKQIAQLKSAQRDGKPDFNVGYMFEQTGSGYRDYYALTLNMRLPRRKRVEGEIAEATEYLNQSKQELDSQVQQQLAEVQKQYVTVSSTEELLKEYQEGLIPQSEAAFHSEEAAYQSNKEQFAPVLSSLLDVLSFEHDYQQALLDHETALAHLEALTGATLR